MEREKAPLRFRDLPRATVLGREVAMASSRRARLLGLAHLDLAAAPAGLLIPRCASVHSFGMRFPLELWFLDRDGEPLGPARLLVPRRAVWRHGAAAVLEIPAPVGGENAPPGT